MKNTTIIILTGSCLSLAVLAGGVLLHKKRSCNCRNQAIATDKDFSVTGHTGCMGTRSNSLESIVTAVKNGATIVEFDLNYNKDNVPVLSHDAPVGDEVTLDEAFRLLEDYPDIKINVDVKNTAYLEKIYPLAEKHGLAHRIFYTGIFENDVEAVKEKSPEVPYYLNMKVNKKQNADYLNSLVKTIKDCGAVGINFQYKHATKELVETFRENGLFVSVWTVDKTSDMYKVINLAPDNITTRNPDKLKEILMK